MDTIWKKITIQEKAGVKYFVVNELSSFQRNLIKGRILDDPDRLSIISDAADGMAVRIKTDAAVENIDSLNHLGTLYVELMERLRNPELDGYTSVMMARLEIVVGDYRLPIWRLYTESDKFRCHDRRLNEIVDEIKTILFKDDTPRPLPSGVGGGSLTCNY